MTCRSGAHSAFKSNWELSVARAFSVIQFLTAHGVDPTPTKSPRVAMVPTGPECRIFPLKIAR